MPLRRDQDSRRVQVNLVADEVVRVQRFEPERVQDGGREILQVEGHDGVRPSVDRGSNDMVVIRVR